LHRAFHTPDRGRAFSFSRPCTYDGRRVVIPNAGLLTGSVIVNTAFDKRRLEYAVGIGYGDDIETARRIMLETVRGVPGVLSEPAPDVLAFDLAGSF